MKKRIFTTNTDAGTVTVLDQDGDQITVRTTIPIGNGPRGAVRCTSNGRGYVGNSCGDTVSEIDTVSCQEVARIQVGPSPTGVGIAGNDRFLLASNSGANSISVVNLDTRKEVARVPVGREPKHMAITADGAHAYVAVFGGHYVAKLDLSSLNSTEADGSGVREVQRISVGEGSHPYSVGLSPDGRYAYVANNQIDYVSVLDLKTDREIHRINVEGKGSRGVAFDPSGTIAYVTIEDRNELLAIDTATRTVIERFWTGPGPRGFALDEQTGTAIISMFARTDPIGLKLEGRPLNLQNSISVINLSQKGLDLQSEGAASYSEIAVGAGPCSVSILSLQ